MPSRQAVKKACLEMLEPYDGKLSRTVLRGLTLLDIKITDSKTSILK